ncbi:hypothetical protein ACFFSY_12285 [Paenibacillus aurantiacus]|uniref:Uncharacterized protein n=1 Tax=Paenibacillus aurantiacus TaxID=1936118 RepID=A0ABV5KNA1_9BACL
MTHRDGLGARGGRSGPTSVEECAGLADDPPPAAAMQKAPEAALASGPRLTRAAPAPSLQPARSCL